MLANSYNKSFYEFGAGATAADTIRNPLLELSCRPLGSEDLRSPAGHSDGLERSPPTSISVNNSRRPTSRLVLLAGLLGSVAPVGAYAQAQRPPNAEAPPSIADANEVKDVVVTAQRRDQRLRDVGIAVTVLDKQAVRDLNISNATDVVRAIPNLRFNAYASSQVVFNMRGVAQNSYGDEQEPPVAVYQDDSYSSSISTAGFPIFDLERVEALRGPQGTLFGRNATGGAVQFISTQPTDQTAGFLSLTYGRYNQTIVEGALQGQIAKDLDARISGQYDRDDGYIKDILPGQPNRGANNHWSLRGIFKWTPSSDFNGKLTLRYTEADHERQAAMYSLSPSCPNEQYQGVDLPANDVCPYWAPDSSYNRPGYAQTPVPAIGGNTTPGAIGTGYYNSAVIAQQGASPWIIAATGNPYVNRQIFGSTLRLEAKLGAFDLTSITDYQYLNKFYNEAGDSQPEFPYVQGATYTPGPCPGIPSVTCYAPGTIFHQQNRTDQYSQELRASTSFGRNYLVFGAFGLAIDGKFNAQYATPFDYYDPEVAFTQRTKSYAAFAQDEFKLNDQWKFILGGRYWNDQKTGCYIGHEYWTGFNIRYCSDSIGFSYDANAPFPGYGAVTSGTGGSITAKPSDARPTYSGITARAEVDYKPTKDTLVYTSYNRGSKSGGFSFSTGTPAPLAVYDTINGIKFNPEELDDYEVGVKTSLPAHSGLSVASYYYNYKNYQAFVQVGYTQEIRNLQAKAAGVEAEFNTHPIAGLTLNLTASWEESHVPGVLLPDGVTVVQHDLPQAPRWSGNALVRYEFPAFGGMALVQADALYQSHMCFSLLCAPVEEEKAYSIANARIGFTPRNSNIDLAFYVNNIFESVYRTYGYDGSLYSGATQSVYGRPRTWAFNVRYHF